MACDCQDECTCVVVDDAATTVVTGDGSAGNPYTISVIGGTSAPTGAMLLWPSALPAPTGFLSIDGAGALFDESLYPNLATILGGTWNTGGEPAGFQRLPDLDDRVLVISGALNALATNDGLAAGARVRDHVHANGSLVTDAQGDHQHTVSGTTGAPVGINTGFMASLTLAEINCIEAAANAQAGCSNVNAVQISVPSINHTHAIGGVTNITGSHAHNVTGAMAGASSPWASVRLIIKT